MVKAIPLQMGEPSLTRLLEPYGNFSPMGVLWASIGASFPYERFAGGAELLASVLLFIPQTALLGALVALIDSIQIFALNMTYDVPVKLFSFHLILLSTFLLAPDIRRLLGVFVFNRPVPKSSQPALGSYPGSRVPRDRRADPARRLLHVERIYRKPGAVQHQGCRRAQAAALRGVGDRPYVHQRRRTGAAGD